MIKNVIFDVGQVLVAWEPVEAMRALGMDEETVRAVADATVHTLSLIHISEPTRP